jgi:hypothetical protein
MRPCRKRLSGKARRSCGRAACPALTSLRADDAMHTLAIELLGDEGEAQLLSDGADEEAPHRVLLPPGLFMIAAIVVPRARLNIAITLACLDAASCSGAGGFSG